jgi:mediator of RNA polymerase II transcription subunit 12, fungi type
MWFAVDLEYSLSLLRTFYAEGLVDNRTFLVWLVQQMAICNLAQLGFVVHMADEYLDGMVTCRALTRPFVESCLGRMSEVSCIIDYATISQFPAR